MKKVNLLSTIQSYKKLNTTNYEKYFGLFKISPKVEELEDLEKLINQIRLINEQINLLDNFFFGYSIPQISKEFDLLRFGSNYTINIELKRTHTGDKIKKQLTRNQYYLSFLGVETFNFTFVADKKELYILDTNNNLVKSNIKNLVEKLQNQKLRDISNIDNLFNPSNYLVSPFNSTVKFINNEYFLTGQQELIKKEVIKKIEEEDISFSSICGRAGTGKTLLTYDIANECINKKLDVIIIHCGILNDGHFKLINDYKWNIIPIKDLTVSELKPNSIIFLDEIQRIYPNQLTRLIRHVKKIKSHCIFSYDKNQWLRSWEMRNNIEFIIDDKTSAKKYNLTKKIRTNKEIASFIVALFNKKRPISTIKKSNIKLDFFDNLFDAKKYMEELKDQDWKVINFTPSRIQTFTYDYYSIPFEDNAHRVIGQEFDKVVAVIDSHFYYADNGELSTKGYKETPYYHPPKMLFQIMTRVRKKLCVIVIDNEEIMERCLKIME